MNQIILSGRLTRNPEIYTAANSQVAHYTLAVDRKFKRQGDEQTADFIRCTCFGKLCLFAQEYLTKGTKIIVTGRIQTGSYIKNGEKIFTTDVIVESQEFCESKSKSATATSGSSFNNNNTFANNATDDAAYQYFN